MPSLIARVTQKIFGGSLTPSGNVAKFGSLAAGAPAYSGDPADIQTAAWLTGLGPSLIGNRSPAIEDLNGVFLTITQQLAYLLQAGVPEWDTNTVYGVNCIARKGALTYRSLTDPNTGNDPSGDPTNWAVFPTPPTLPKQAWVRFNGHDGSIFDSVGVSGVVRNSAGVYTISFTSDFASANYAWSGSCSATNGGPQTGGNNNIIIGGGGQFAGSLKVINWESTGGPIGPEDGDCICVLVTGK